LRGGNVAARLRSPKGRPLNPKRFIAFIAIGRNDTILMPKLVRISCAVLLVVGAFPLPYGYYSLLRLVACFVFAIGTYDSQRAGAHKFVWINGFFALLFNPLFKIYLPKGVWIFLDLLAAGVLIWSLRANDRNAQGAPLSSE